MELKYKKLKIQNSKFNVQKKPRDLRGFFLKYF